jgi:O-antigen ligase
MAPMFGLGTDESGGGFRPFGLSYHPNGLANQHLILLSSILFLSSYLNNKDKLWKKIIGLAASLSLIVIILSLSRAALLAIFVALVIIVIRQPEYISVWRKSIKNSLGKLKLWHRIVVILLVSVLIFKLTDRLFNSIYSFSENGGINTRLTEYEEALLVFSKSPIFGIGEQMFIPTSYQLFPKGVMSYFPENVHNGYLLLMTEKGIVGIALYIIFFFLFIKEISKSRLTKKTKTMLYSGLSTGLTMMILHPEKNFLSLIVLLGIAIVHYEKNIKKNIN